MNTDDNQPLIDTIVTKSLQCDNSLHDNVLELIELYRKGQEDQRKLLKQNQFFLKQWDKNNILLKEKDAKKDRMLEQQSKMAAMGEMMDAVAHQWKQPLNALSMFGQLLSMDYDEGNVDKVYIENLVKDADEQIEHMISTLTEFRTFFRPDKEPEPFGLKRCIQTVLLLMKDELLRNQIEVEVDSEHEVIITGIENEFKHLILNVINNAKDVFKERERKNRKIFIRFYQEDGNVILKIEDNGGGVPDEIIKDIFKPNITSKSEGTGIGLYMSAQIAQKMNGQLYVANTERGAEFTLEVTPCCI